MIITVAAIKKHIINDVDDGILTAKISAAESFIRKYTNNNFQVREVRSQSNVKNNVVLNPPYNISVGDTVEISKSPFNNGIYTVTGVDKSGMTLSSRLCDCEDNLVTKVYYPSDVVDGVIGMIKWDLANRDKAGIQSEKISRHSVTYFNCNDEGDFGYPKSVLGFLKPYKKARF